MVKCSFCGKDEDSFKGVHLIKNDGSVIYFCSSKCKANQIKLKRDKRKIRWTEAFHEKREKARAKLKAVAK
jgi:large subunit ribosomal protein L24e